MSKHVSNYFELFQNLSKTHKNVSKNLKMSKKTF
jgi:hypothetical protein